MYIADGISLGNISMPMHIQYIYNIKLDQF